VLSTNDLSSLRAAEAEGPKKEGFHSFQSTFSPKYYKKTGWGNGTAVPKSCVFCNARCRRSEQEESLS
jgi:hypothetical protein